MSAFDRFLGQKQTLTARRPPAKTHDLVPNPLIPIAFPKRTALPDGSRLLAADVGGTKTDLARFVVRSGELFLEKEAVFLSKNYGSLAEIVRDFSAGADLPERLSIAFAGPIFDGKAKATNLDWGIDAEELKRNLGVRAVFLLNDLEANAFGLAALIGADLKTVFAGKNGAYGNAAIIAPGTGLGEAGLFWDGTALHPFATEGGHSDFAPRDQIDWEFLLFLQKQFGHVSWERAISGPGIHQIFRFLTEIKKKEVPPIFFEKIKNGDPAAEIAHAAGEGCLVCGEVLRLFVQYLAIESASLALKFKATGGIFLGGGILPKIWDENLQGIFLEHFFEVGRLRHLIGEIPVKLILEQKTALLGAAWFGK